MRAVIVVHLVLQLLIVAIATGSALGGAATPREAGLCVLLSLAGAACTWRAASTLRLLEPYCAD